MAHKKAAGSAKNLRDSNPKYRGLKLAGGQAARAGNIIIRQKGSKYECGENTYFGKDYTIHAAVDGVVVFGQKNYTRFDGRRYLKTFVSVLSVEDIANQAKENQTSSSSQEKKTPKAKKSAPKKAAKTQDKITQKVEAKAKKQVHDMHVDSLVGDTDDLTKIEGIGPKIQEVLHGAGIKTYANLSGSKVGDLRALLADNGLSNHEPKTWKKQATLAKNGKWEELKKLQEELIAGK